MAFRPRTSLRAASTSPGPESSSQSVMAGPLAEKTSTTRDHAAGVFIVVNLPVSAQSRRRGSGPRTGSDAGEGDDRGPGRDDQTGAGGGRAGGAGGGGAVPGAENRA